MLIKSKSNSSLPLINNLDNLNNQRNMKLFLLSTSAMLIVNAALTGAHDYTNTHMQVQGQEQATDVSEVQLVSHCAHDIYTLNCTVLLNL